MKFFVFLFISISLFATDILTLYRKNGISEIEKQMDIELMGTEYWSKYLSDKDTRFGFIEKYSNILTCDKEKSTLTLYRLANNKTYKLQKQYSAYTGKLKGDKVKEGDLKTPIGIYNLVKKLKNVDSFYGPMAFVTSYPNLYDKYRGKSGHGIWIHGLPTKQQRDEFTKGCIAINNPNIECLDRHIDIDKTILIINNKEVKKDISKDTLSLILAQLYEWRYAWKYNELDRYLSFYDKNFLRADGMNYNRFVRYKSRVFKKIEKRTIVFKDINLIPYPNTDDIYQITFREFYKSDTFEFTGEKILVVKLDNTQKIKILTEK